MTAEPVAELLLRREPRRVFVAATCVLEPPLVHATGRWRHRCGPNYAEVAWGPLESFVWPIAELARVRWLDAQEMS